MYANSIMFSSTSQIKDIEAAGAVELADKIKQLKGGEPGQVKAETERLTSESKKMIAALVEKIKVESEGKFAEYQQTLEVDENDAESFGAWIGNYERADRVLIAAEKKFKETLRELDDYRQGLGELLRRADDLIIDGEFQEDVTGAAEIESQVPAAVPPVVLPAVIAKEPVAKIQPMMPQRNQTSAMIFNQVSMPRQPNDVATRASSDAEIETAASVDEVTETNTSEDALTGFAPPAAPREETTLLAEDQRQTDEPSEDTAIDDVPNHDVGRAEAAVVAAAPGASDRAARA
jgi:hypothetical protein